MFKEIALGELAATLTDLLIDIPLSKAGMLYAVEFRDDQGRFIWGYGSGDLLIDLAGGLMLAFKVKKNFALGWLLAHGLLKLGELYGYIRDTMGITPKTIGPLKFRQRLTTIDRFRRRR